MAIIQVTAYEVEIMTDRSFTWMPFDPPIYKNGREYKTLAELQAAVANLIDFYEMSGREVMITTRVVKGRAMKGYRAWAEQTQLTRKADIKQAA